MFVSEISLNPNNSIQDTEYQELFRRIIPEATESHQFHNTLKSINFLRHEEQRPHQNLAAIIEGGEPGSCELLKKFSRYLLIKTFGPNLASNIIQVHNCDQPEDPPRIHLYLPKPLHSRVKPSSLYRALKVLKNLGVKIEMRQPKKFSLPKHQMLRTRKLQLKPNMKQNGRYIKIMIFFPFTGQGCAKLKL